MISLSRRKFYHINEVLGLGSRDSRVQGLALRPKIGKTHHRSSRDWRLRLILYIFTFFFAALAARLFYIQVIKHEYYAVLADKQHWSYHELPARRGKIFSSDGFPLASVQDFYALYAEPKDITDPQNTAKRLVPILHSRQYQKAKEKYDYTTIANLELSLASKLSSDNVWVLLQHKISPEDRQFIEDLDIPGLGFEEEPVRFYPEGNLAAHILGFVGEDEQNRIRGYYGLEGYYNGDLMGKAGVVYEETTATGDPILVGGRRRLAPVEGRDIYTTLERAVQFMVENKLEEGVKKYGARSGMIIVLEPQSGKVLALAVFPRFELHVWQEDDVLCDEGECESWQRREVSNLAISQTYEPGSVMKPITLAAGLDLGLIEPQSTFEDTGPIVVSDYLVDNWDGKHHGTQTMVQLLQKSNNVGACKVGLQIGSSRLIKYLSNFGYGSRLGIDLEGEETGILPESENWRDIKTCNASFGQGISATPLQVVASFAAIVNNGVLMRPYVVSHIGSQGEVLVAMSPTIIDRAIKEQTSKVLVEMLEAAVSGGESKFYNLRDYRVAGKTGTAQIPLPTGGYDSEKTNATFVGFLPSDPKFVMLVRLEEPSSSIFASETAVPLWMEITRDLAAYYGIAPDR